MFDKNVSPIRHCIGMHLKLFGLTYKAAGQIITDVQEFILFNKLCMFSFNSLI